MFSPKILQHSSQPEPRALFLMSTDPLLQLLRLKARISHQELGDLLSMKTEAVTSRIEEWEKNGTILGYHTVIDSEAAGDKSVSAFIEVRLTVQ